MLTEQELFEYLLALRYLSRWVDYGQITDLMYAHDYYKFRRFCAYAERSVS